MFGGMQRTPQAPVGKGGCPGVGTPRTRLGHKLQPPATPRIDAQHPPGGVPIVSRDVDFSSEPVGLDSLKDEPRGPPVG